MRERIPSTLFGIALLSFAACGGSGGGDAAFDDATASGATTADASLAEGAGSEAGTKTDASLFADGASHDGAGPTGSGGAGGSSASTGGAAGGGTGAGAAGGGTTDGGTVGYDGGCGNTACTNCIDDDNDGLVDWKDPDCTGPLDNDEATFATGIPGDNVDPCKQDCFFDGNSGSGDDRCLFDVSCDPKSPGAPKCPYDPKTKNCGDPTSEACKAKCLGLVPNGCDCFGCCVVPSPTGGTVAIKLVPTCTFAKADDPSVCPPCTQVADCTRPCGHCELCLGKTVLPLDCFPDGGANGPDEDAGPTGSGGSAGSGTGGAGGSSGGSSGSGGSSAGGSGGAPAQECPSGVQACNDAYPCPPFSYCLTGCCIVVPR